MASWFMGKPTGYPTSKKAQNWYYERDVNSES
jgi:hypothetical protein